MRGEGGRREFKAARDDDGGQRLNINECQLLPSTREQRQNIRAGLSPSLRSVCRLLEIEEKAFPESTGLPLATCGAS